jgi:hypothetical protein
MNWKLMRESERSSGNQRTVQMVVDCSSAGAVKVHDVVTTANEPNDLRLAVEQGLGAPIGANSVKYLVFRDQNHSSFAGVGYGYAGQSSSSQGWALKSSSDSPNVGVGNPNRAYTTTAIVWHGLACCPSPWGSHVTLHEIFHSMGASQYVTGDPAPFATPGAHCIDGLDALCYGDGTLGGCSETRCPANGFYDTSEGTPIDCGYDTYFDTVTESGEWLDTHWNTGGPENPFLAEIQPASESPTTSITSVAAASMFPDRIDLFARTASNGVYHKAYHPSVGWGQWENVDGPLNGAVTSDLSASSQGSGYLTVWARGADNALWHREYHPGGWSVWTSLGGQLASPPGAISRPGYADVFARMSNNTVQQREWSPFSGWDNWFSLGSSGGPTTSAPAGVARLHDQVQIFIQGTSNAIWSRSWSPATGWTGWASWGGTATSAPAAVSWGAEHAALFMRGSDNGLWYRYWTPSTGWVNWTSLGGTLASAPTATSSAPGRIDVFARTTTNRVQQKTFSNGVWSGWQTH